MKNYVGMKFLQVVRLVHVARCTQSPESVDVSAGWKRKTGQWLLRSQNSPPFTFEDTRLTLDSNAFEYSSVRRPYTRTRQHSLTFLTLLPHKSTLGKSGKVLRWHVCFLVGPTHCLVLRATSLQSARGPSSLKIQKYNNIIHFFSIF